MAQVLGVHRSTINRELRRNTGARGYRPKQAQAQALQRRVKAKPRIATATWQVVEEKLRQDWSPEQISRWLAQRQAIRISHEWIYQHILADQRAGGKLYTHLRCHPKRRKRYGGHDRRGQLPNRVSIDQRPLIVAQRTRLGDWEADTVIGQRHRGALVSLVERKSRFTLIQPVAHCGADLVSQAVLDLLRPVQERVQTITSDNGKEFANHVQVAEALQASFYFAHPYSAWERGTNENTNGLIRQYFPKQTDFSVVNPSTAADVASKLNHRPRKCLDFKTPFEVFFEQAVALAS